MIRFRVEAESGSARAGSLETERCSVPTPAFMPVGTYGAVKAVSPGELAATGTRMLITNTYHLWLRPGAELIAEQGGLHAFMRWPHAVATDSGGFQAFSLSSRARVGEDGFELKSHLDGSRRLLSPEEAMRIQGLLGSDIALQLDVCPPAGAPRTELLSAVERTTRWAERCLEARTSGQALFGIVQGGTDVELRLGHLERLSELPFDGMALGGFSVGEPPEEMHRALLSVVPAMDAARPRYLMGVGTPADLVRAIGAGIDLFDCVLPTRNARNGQAFLTDGRINIRNARFRSDTRPLEATCRCPTCTGGFSRAYIRHLFLTGEILAHRLLTLHNLQLYGDLVAAARVAIGRNGFAAWAEERLARWGELATAAEPGHDPP